MKILLQPEGSSLCGQACVAMLAGITLEESIKVFGSRAGTSTKQVVEALRSLGVKCADGLTRITKSRGKSEACMVVQHFDGAKHTHWVVYLNGLYYDPSIGIIFPGYPDFVRETSFLEIKP